MNKIIATLYVLFLFSISIIIFFLTDSILIRCLIVLNALVSIFIYCLNIFSFKSKINHLTHYIFNTFDKTTQNNKEYEETIESKLLHQINKYKQELDIEKEETIHSKQEIQSLVTHISHQVKTPLANIKIYNDLLARNDLSKEEAIDFHQMLNKQINKLDFLMESLIKMSRLETDIIQLNIEKNDLYSTLIEVINHVFLLAEKKHINIELSKNTHISALYDEKWTQEAIFNVLENCIKYSNKNTTITIQISKNTFFSKITITDQGIGIKKENYNNIFQRFYRSQEVQDEDGIGIGLYLTREILSKEEGYIIVQSEYGKGSTFTIYLKR
jgi:signal transduction histidine kinase|nr:HAMP domain-containing sensor histidine kinase [uncultured Faecalibacillus sp.]